MEGSSQLPVAYLSAVIPQIYVTQATNNSALKRTKSVRDGQLQEKQIKTELNFSFRIFFSEGK